MARKRRLSAWAAVSALLLTLTAACTDEPSPTDPENTETPSTSGQPDSLTFGVFGPQGEVNGYKAMARKFPDSDVRVMAWRDADEAARAFRSGMDLPDVFLLPRRNIEWFTDQGLTQPVDELLDERGVNFGDDYSRDALQAFAFDDSLQCMPFSLSPMVVYYNTDLVDFERMEQRELDVPSTASRWTFEEFSAAARFASRPGRGTKGVWIEPSIRGLAPFVLSGGGQLFDDETDPTSLDFSNEDTQAALETTLEVLRNAQLTPTQAELRRMPALEQFKAGKLGMIAGFRSLTPQLRNVDGLKFDVMPMPTIDDQATIGDFVGLCMSSSSVDPPLAADFLVHALSEDSVSDVVKAGFTVPANVRVAVADDFVQKGRQPSQAHVFTDSIRHIQLQPTVDSWTRLDESINPLIAELVTDPVLDLPALSTEIDEASTRVLDPGASPTPSEQE